MMIMDRAKIHLEKHKREYGVYHLELKTWNETKRTASYSVSLRYLNSFERA